MNCCPSCGQPSPANYLGLVFDWKGRLVSRDGTPKGAPPVRLTYTLLVILDALAAGRGEIVPDAILLRAYRPGIAACDRLINKKVSYIRIAVAPLGLGIETVRGKGYRLIDTARPAKAA